MTKWIASRAEWRTDGLRVTDADMHTFAGMVGAAARPIDDHRSTADYRKHAVTVMALRALRRCVS